MLSRDPLYAERLIAALNELETLHDASANQAHQNYYLKLALLELCGWVEETQDVILGRLAGYWLETNRKNFDGFVKRNSGISYENNFRDLLQRLVGLRGLELVEVRISRHRDADTVRTCAEMYALLDTTLRAPRNAHAHTFAGVQSTPLNQLLHFSVLKNAAITIDRGLRMLERELCAC